VLIQLTADPDQVVNSQANSTLENLEDEKLEPLLRNEQTDPEILKYFCFDPNRGAAVLEAVAMNNSTPDDTIAELCLVADSALLEIILLNQTRIIRHPAILDNISLNQAATAEIRRRLHEIQEEFFRKQGASYSARTTEAPPPKPAIVSFSETPVEAEAAPQAPLEVEVPFRAEDFGCSTRQEVSTFQKISQLNTSEKVKLALLGSREERVILIRDPNRVVAGSVLKSPKITENEIEAISQMRNVSEDILRIVGNKREWIKNYSVVRNLVRNPKTPIAISMHLISRIMENDMRLLARDKAIPEVVRRTAARSLLSKN
jgi:hypothetical protein